MPELPVIQNSNCLQDYNLGRDALPTTCFPQHCVSFLGARVRSPPPVPSYQTETESTYSGPFSRVPLVYPSYQPGHNTFASSGLSQSGFVRFADFPDRAREVEFIHN